MTITELNDRVIIASDNNKINLEVYYSSDEESIIVFGIYAHGFNSQIRLSKEDSRAIMAFLQTRLDKTKQTTLIDKDKDTNEDQFEGNE